MALFDKFRVEADAIQGSGEDPNFIAQRSRWKELSGVHWKPAPRRLRCTLQKGVDKLVPLRIAWHPSASVWAQREHTCESKSFVDLPAIQKKSFEADWKMVWHKSSLQDMINNSLGSINDDEKAAFKKACKKGYGLVLTTHQFYSATSKKGDGFAADPTAFRKFLTDANLLEPDSKFMNQAACDAIFMVTNVEVGDILRWLL
jgi:hypothetical protein